MSNKCFRNDKFQISVRNEGWTVIFYEGNFCRNVLFPGRSFQSAAVTQDCTPFPRFESGLPKSINWVPGDGFSLLLFKDESCIDEPIVHSGRCTGIETPDFGIEGSISVTAFSVVNASIPTAQKW